MATIQQLAKNWWIALNWSLKDVLSNFYYEVIQSTLLDKEVENIFYNEVIIKWYQENHKTKHIIPKNIKIATYLKEHTKEQPTLDEEVAELEAELWNSPTGAPESLGQSQSVDNTIEMKHLEQPQILKDFITAIRSEFKDENWDYLDFIADRVIKKQPKANEDVWDELAVLLKDDFGESIIEDGDEDNPLDWWLQDVTVADIVDKIKQHYSLIKK